MVEKLHLEPKDFDYSIVVNVLKELNKYCTKDQLVVLISTVLPGTTRREFIQHTSNYRFIYNPYLIAMGSVNWDMINPEMVIIGTEDGSVTGDAKILIDFYKTMMQNDPRYEVHGMKRKQSKFSITHSYQQKSVWLI
jgi:UDPglucose 6-dehydrogenase